jgi:hypothetical protein
LAKKTIASYSPKITPPDGRARILGARWQYLFLLTIKLYGNNACVVNTGQFGSPGEPGSFFVGADRTKDG